MNNDSFHSPNSHPLNDAVTYGSVETKRPARDNNTSEASYAAGAGASFQYPQRSRSSEYRNSSKFQSITMIKDVLRPPNSHTLNDAVIYGIVETKRPPRNVEMAKVQYPQQCRTSEHVLSTELTRTHLGEAEAAVAIYHTITSPVATTRLSSDSNLSSQEAAGISTERKPEAERGANPYETTILQVLAERDRIRELRRERQIRYRRKKHDYMLSLEAETKILREQIRDLKQRRASLSTVDSKGQNVWNVAVGYFKLFRFGLPADAATNISVQSSFLRASMSSDVTYNAQQGIGTIITSWRYITYAFQALEMELEGLVRSVDGSLIATTRTSISISEHTIRNVFPRLRGEALNRLAGKLVGHRFQLCGVTRFEWDVASRRVSAVVSQSDMLTPMLSHVGNLEDLSRVFDNSRISPLFQWNFTNS